MGNRLNEREEARIRYTSRQFYIYIIFKKFTKNQDALSTFVGGRLIKGLILIFAGGAAGGGGGCSCA